MLFRSGVVGLGGCDEATGLVGQTVQGSQCPALRVAEGEIMGHGGFIVAEIWRLIKRSYRALEIMPLCTLVQYRRQIL